MAFSSGFVSVGKPSMKKYIGMIVDERNRAFTACRSPSSIGLRSNARIRSDPDSTPIARHRHARPLEQRQILVGEAAERVEPDVEAREHDVQLLAHHAFEDGAGAVEVEEEVRVGRKQPADAVPAGERLEVLERDVGAEGARKCRLCTTVL